MEGAVESVMAGELRTKKVMMKLRLTVEVRDGGDGIGEGGVIEREA